MPTFANLTRVAHVDNIDNLSRKHGLELRRDSCMSRIGQDGYTANLLGTGLTQVDEMRESDLSSLHIVTARSDSVHSLQ